MCDIVEALWQRIKQKYEGSTRIEMIKIAYHRFSEMQIRFSVIDGEIKGPNEYHKYVDDDNIVEVLCTFLKSRGKTTDEVIDSLYFFNIPWGCDKGGNIVTLRVPPLALPSIPEKEGKERSPVLANEPKRMRINDTPMVSYSIEDSDSAKILADKQKKKIIALYAYGAIKETSERAPLISLMNVIGEFKYRINTADRDKMGNAPHLKVRILYGDIATVIKGFDFPTIGIIDSDEDTPQWMINENCIVILHYDYIKNVFLDLTIENLNRIKRLFSTGA